MTGRPLRVLHVPDSVGGHAPGLARAEREIGLESSCVALTESPFAYAVDEVLRRPGDGRIRFEQRRIRLLLHALRDVDVVHFNFGRTFLPVYLPPLDLALLRAAGTAVFVTFQGDDARQGDAAQARGGDALPTRLPHLYSPRSDRRKRRRITWFDRFADGIFYLNPDLAHVLPPSARFVPYAHVDPREWVPCPDARAVPPLVVHAPSDPEVKGTDVIEAALRGLAADGAAVEWQRVQGLPHGDVRRLFARASIGVDQLYAGWYGGVAVEWMALGVPAVAYIRTDELGVIPAGMRDELPVVSAGAADVQTVVAALLRDSERRKELGERGRAFVERWHDPIVIASRLRRRYESAARARGSGGTRRARAPGSAPTNDD